MSLTIEEREIAACCADQYPPHRGPYFFSDADLGNYDEAAHRLAEDPSAWEHG